MQRLLVHESIQSDQFHNARNLTLVMVPVRDIALDPYSVISVTFSALSSPACRSLMPAAQCLNTRDITCRACRFCIWAMDAPSFPRFRDSGLPVS